MLRLKHGLVHTAKLITAPPITEERAASGGAGSRGADLPGFIAAGGEAKDEGRFLASARPPGSDLSLAERGEQLRFFDAQIAAIARSAGPEIVTRNVADFSGCGVKLVNPWDS